MILIGRAGRPPPSYSRDLQQPTFDDGGPRILGHGQVVALRFEPFAVAGAPRDTRRRGPQLIAACAVVALLAYVGSGVAAHPIVPAIIHGFTPAAGSVPRHAQDGSADAGRRMAKKAGIDVDSVVDRLSHRMTPMPNRPGTLITSDGHSRASFDAAGFHVAPVGATHGLTIGITSIGRRDMTTPASPAAWRAKANVASRAIGPGATERITSTSGTLEWDVVIQRRPAGTGPFRLEASIGGVVAAHQLHGRGRPVLQLTLRDGHQVEIGELVVVDATGATLHRALPVVHGSRLHLDVPGSVLAAARYPLTLDPSVSVSHPVGSVPAPLDQGNAAVAWNGTDFLVVWHDDRVVGLDLYAARVNAAGALLDPTGIPIGTGHGVTGKPAVASDGNGFVVVWEDPRNGGQSDIYGTRISAAGVLLDAVGFPVSTAAGYQSGPTIAWNSNGASSSYLVAWSSGGDIFGVRLSRAGAIVGANPISISIATGTQSSPTVAAQGSLFFLAWSDGRNGGNSTDIYGTRVDASGAVLETAGIAISTASGAQQAPAIASDGTNLLIVWENADGGVFQIRAVRMDASGVVLAPTDIPISPGGFDIAPSVARSGSDFVVAWQEFRLDNGTFDIRGRRVTNAGAALDPGGFAISSGLNQEATPAVVWNGTNDFAVWQDTRNSGTGSDIYGARVNGGTALDPTGIAISTSLTTDPQQAPAIAWTGTIFFVVWQDLRSQSTEDVYGARLDASGNLIDPAGILLSTAPDGQYVPSVAWNGSNFLVVWEDFRSGSNYDIYGTRVNTSGTVLDPFGIPVSPATGDQFQPSVASNGTNFEVVWQDDRSGTGDIYGTLIANSGAVGDPPGTPISTAGNFQSAPSVASNGSGFLAVWTDERTSPSDIYGAHLNSLGGLLDPVGIPISTVTGVQVNPAIAWNGLHYFVAWADARSGAEDIYGTRLNSTGGPLETNGIVVSAIAGPQDDPSVAATGTTFLVAWREGRNPSYDVYATEVNDGGVVQDPNGFAVSSLAANEFSPAASSGPNGGWGVVDLQFLDDGQGTFLHTVSTK